MLKRTRLCATLLCSVAFYLPAVTQTNLIPNGNFESVSPIPIYQTPVNTNSPFPAGWSMPTDGTPDVISDFNAPCDYFFNPPFCFPQVCDIDNTWGSQGMMPATDQYGVGHVYMGLATSGISTQFFNSYDFREYLRCTLNVAGGLSAGQCYRLTYWVSLADMSTRATTVQAVITNQDFTNMNSFAGVIDPSSCPLWFKPRHPIKHKQDWIELHYDFVAEGGETYLYLGFFEDESSTTIDDDLTGFTEDVDHTSCTSNSAYTQANNHRAYYYIDNVSMYATAGPSFTPDYTFNSSNSVISGSYSNAEILISGDISVSGIVTFSGCTIKCNDGSTITIPQNTELKVYDNTTIEAGCQNMWDGIILDYGVLDVRGSRISDARVAITVNSSIAHWYIRSDVANHLSTFSRNIVDMIVNGATSGTNQIVATIFDHSIPLNDPAEGNGGYGTNFIVFNGSIYPGNIETIGGPNPSDGCLFLAGESAVVSKNQNLSVNNCIFSGQSSTSVDFQGTLSNSSLIRNLTVRSSTFIQGKSHIKSYLKTSLTVESSSFSNSAEHSVMWLNNPDCHLKVGDDTDPNKGNVFNNNGWTAVAAMGNTTAEHNYGNLSNPLNTVYTTIEISNNKVNGPAWATGFLVTEYALGSHVAYQSLSISHNVMSGLSEGILVTNVRGWGGIFPPGSEPLGLPPTWICQNQILASAVLVPAATCIKVDNAPGLNITQNGMDSDNNQNWQNTGIRVDNSEYTEIEGNAVGAGRGIITGGSMLWSNVHCNTLVGNVAGIVLGWCALRPNPGSLHGSNIESYPNNFILSPPWHTDIHNWYSSIPMNQWVWSNFVTPTYPSILYDGVTGLSNQSGINTSIISLLEGPFECSGDPYRKPAPASPNVISNVSDPDLQWRYDYNYQIVKNNTNQGSNNIAGQAIKRIIKIENAINSGDYNLASAQMNGFNPTNLIEQNYKTVLQIMLNFNSPVRRNLDASEIATLTQIAEQNPRTSGTSVTLARGILRFQLNLKFKDEEYATEDRVKGTAFIQTPCCLAPASGTQLTFVDQFGNYLPITPALVDQEGNFSFDPYKMKYYIDLDPGTLFRVVSSPGSKFTVLNKDFKTLSDWLLASPIEIILGGTKEDYVTTSAFQNTSIAANTSVSDADGNIYTVGSVSSASGSDFLIEKRNAAGNVIWIKNFHGPAAGNDTATCTTFGSDGHLYVAGKVWNGNSYNFATLKYDTTGFMQWETILEDTVFDDTPAAIGFYAADTSVMVTGRCGNSNQVYYKTVKYKQCVVGPNSSRLSNHTESNVISTKPVSYYPNPNSGSITIATGGSGCAIELYNVNGQVVWTKLSLNDGAVEFPENQVPDGVYLCKFTMTDGQTQFEKMIIQRN